MSDDAFLSRVERISKRPVTASGAPLLPDSKRTLPHPERDGLVARITGTGKVSWHYRTIDKKTRKYVYQKIIDHNKDRFHEVVYAWENIRIAARQVAARDQSLSAVRTAEKKEVKAASARTKETLRSAYETYITTKRLSDATLTSMKYSILSNAKDWLDKPAAAITVQSFEAKFKKIFERTPSVAHKFRRYLKAILRASEKRNPGLFPNGVPVSDKTELRGYDEPDRKSSRLAPTDFPALLSAVSTASDYERHFILLMLLTGLRAEAVRTLRYDNCNLQIKASAWSKGEIQVYDATIKRSTKPLVVSSAVQAIIFHRHELHGDKSPWLFWHRTFGEIRHREDFEAPLKDHRRIFERLAMKNDEGERLTAHDLRRTFAWVGRIACRCDKLVVMSLMLHSLKNLDVSDGYVGLKDDDFRRETNTISGKMISWLQSTPEIITAELHPSEAGTSANLTALLS